MSDNENQQSKLIEDVVCSFDHTDDKKQAHQSNVDADVTKKHAEAKKMKNVKKSNQNATTLINPKYSTNDVSIKNKTTLPKAKDTTKRKI